MGEPLAINGDKKNSSYYGIFAGHPGFPAWGEEHSPQAGQRLLPVGADERAELDGNQAQSEGVEKHARPSQHDAIEPRRREARNYPGPIPKMRDARVGRIRSCEQQIEGGDQHKKEASGGPTFRKNCKITSDRRPTIVFAMPPAAGIHRLELPLEPK